MVWFEKKMNSIKIKIPAYILEDSYGHWKIIRKNMILDWVTDG